jgi:hypothetical protein
MKDYKNVTSVGFEVLTAVVIKSTIFRDITPCSPLRVNQRFAGTYRLHLQGRKRGRARYQRESCFHPTVHGDISQKMVLFIVTSACCLLASTLRMEAGGSSDMSVNVYETTRRHILGVL